MSQKGQLLGRGLTGTATAAISARRCCKRVAGGWAQCSTQGEKVDGISRADYNSGDTNASFEQAGYSTVYAGAAIAEAAEVMTDANGKVITYVAGTGVYRCGKADQAASGADALIVIQHYATSVV